ncbi:MAG: AMP-binding protein [Chloroflexi bacterium]|nr:AMP-binding protein [Chloroflexota bacterium]
MEFHNTTIYEIIQKNARLKGHRMAVISAERTFTHAQFLERVDQLAVGLSAEGISKGDRICILAQNSTAYFELYGACARTGAIAYPVNWRLSSDEIKGVLELADPQMLVVGIENLPQINGLDVTRFRVRAMIGEGTIEGFIPLSELYHPKGSPPAKVSGDDPFAIISTAAVAGAPRGAILTHTNLLTAGDQIINALGLTGRDRHLAALPFFHITGLGLSLALMQAGGANVVMEKFDPAQAVRMMDEHAVTLVADFPPILQMLLDARQATGASLASLEHVAGLDAPDAIHRLYAETNAKFWTGFGQSETSGLVTMARVDEKPGSAGKPLPVAQVRCVNEAGQDAPIGQPGEIVVRGPLVFAGYWRDPDATKFASRHGWHHTGDVGRFDEEGYLYYVGRKPEKDLIKSGGENIYPAEVENVILEMPEVAAVCVIGVPNEKWGETVKAVIELQPGRSLTLADVSRYVAGQIASYKKPRLVDFVDANSLPRDENGELDRAKIKEIHS